jgi:hypothetical protein
MKRAGLLAVGAVVLGLAYAPKAQAAFGLFGGMHGSALSHYVTDTATDPIKGGLIGISYGYQVGADLEWGRLWLQPQFDMDYVWVGDYEAATYREYRYDNPSAVIPLMFRIVRSNLAFGIGPFYKVTLGDQSDPDWGVTLAMKKPFAGKLYWNLQMHLGFQQQDEGGNRQQINAGIGYAFK